jgi:hypothetical protein
MFLRFPLELKIFTSLPSHMEPNLINPMNEYSNASIISPDLSEWYNKQVTKAKNILGNEFNSNPISSDSEPASIFIKAINNLNNRLDKLYDRYDAYQNNNSNPIFERGAIISEYNSIKNELLSLQIPKMGKNQVYLVLSNLKDITTSFDYFENHAVNKLNDELSLESRTTTHSLKRLMKP